MAAFVLMQTRVSPGAYEAAHVIGQIGEPDLHFDSGDADCPYDDLHHPLLMREHMLDCAAQGRGRRRGIEA